jgi:hypothetical protein
MSQYLTSDSEDKKGRVWAITGTLVFHTLLILILFWVALRTPLPLPGEEGVEVNLGNSDNGMGDIQPEEAAMLASSAAAPQPAKANDELITEANDENPALEKVNKKTNKQNTVTPTKPTPQPEVVKQPVVNQNALFKGKSNKTTKGGSEGITGKPGDQGKPNGTPDGKGYDGQGGKGNGPSFSLEGRGAKSLPKPVYNSDDQGFIVVTISVNKEGRVTRAVAGARGTTISDQQLWKQAEKAAMRAMFTSNPDAAEVQKGSIKYTFLKTR